jgi:hypothetical protein
MVRCISTMRLPVNQLLSKLQGSWSCIACTHITFLPCHWYIQYLKSPDFVFHKMKVICSRARDEWILLGSVVQIGLALGCMKACIRGTVRWPAVVRRSTV